MTNIIQRLGAIISKRGASVTLGHPSTISTLFAPAGAAFTHPDIAESIAAVYACVGVVSEGVASLPLKLYRREGASSTLALDHSLYSVLHDTPNDYQTGYELKELLMVHVLLRGNAYCEIETNGRGDVVALWPIHPDRVYVWRNDPTDTSSVYPGYAGLLYRVNVPGKGDVILTQDRIWHIRGRSKDGILGQSPVAVARYAVAGAVAAENMAAKVYENNATPNGVLTYPGELSDEAYKNIADSWKKRHGGDNAGGVAILEKGMAYASVGMSLHDAEFLASRKFQKSEIASIFRVPPHLIGDLDKATFSNIEQQSLDFVINTLQPWLVRIEQSITRDLIGKLERARVFAKFSIDGRLRGDTASRYNAYHIARNDGWLSANDIRALEDLNPIPGGDVYWQPLNMATGNGARGWVGGFTVAMRDAMGRVLRRELQDVGRRASVDITRFEKDHTDFVTRNLSPVVAAAAAYMGLSSAEVAKRVGDYLDSAAQGRIEAVRAAAIGEDWVETNLDASVMAEVNRFETVFMSRPALSV